MGQLIATELRPVMAIEVIESVLPETLQILSSSGRTLRPPEDINWTRGKLDIRAITTKMVLPTISQCPEDDVRRARVEELRGQENKPIIVTVIFDPQASPCGYHLVDGWHRLQAAALDGKDMIEAYLGFGDNN